MNILKSFLSLFVISFMVAIIGFITQATYIWVIGLIVSVGSGISFIALLK